jgi:hypothetical protein
MSSRRDGCAVKQATEARQALKDAENHDDPRRTGHPQLYSSVADSR